MLLTNIFVRLELQSKKFSVFTSASSSDIDLFWEAMLSIDSALTDPFAKYKKATLAKNRDLWLFFEHCCHVRHYTFSALKCGDPSCTTCKPVRLPSDVFKRLHHLPDPTLGDNGHHKPFEEVFGKKTTEEGRPSNKRPFVPSIQHA